MYANAFFTWYVMLHNIDNTHTKIMAIGTSGRIVIEMDPERKQELYSVLEGKGLNLKKWFLAQVDDLLEDDTQLSLDLPLNYSNHMEVEKK